MQPAPTQPQLVHAFGQVSVAPSGVIPYQYRPPQPEEPLALDGKRKAQAEGGAAPRKRRRHENTHPDDEGPNGGPKHWTDEEKTRLFRWVMGPGRDMQFNSLQACKNGCLRECSQQLFDGRKTYQALKGAFERSFAVFKQIFRFKKATAHLADARVNMNIPAHRLEEYERLVRAAEDEGVELGTLNARILDQWHRHGWYDLFYTRYHSDPATTQREPEREEGAGAGALDPQLEMSPPPMQPLRLPDDAPPAPEHSPPSSSLSNAMLAASSPQMAYSPMTPLAHSVYAPSTAASSSSAVVPARRQDEPKTSNTRRRAAPPSPPSPGPMYQPSPAVMYPPSPAAMPPPSVPANPAGHDALCAIVKMQGEMLEALKKREAEHDGIQRVQMKAELARQLVSDREADQGVKQAAADYLKKLFLAD